MIKYFIFVFMIVSTGLLFSGCETVSGMSRDSLSSEGRKYVTAEKKRVNENKKRAQGCLHLIDFNDESITTVSVARFGAWDKDPSDKTQTCSFSFKKDIIYGLETNALQINYDVDSPNPALNGFFLKLRNIDLRRYKLLIISIKGDGESGYPSDIDFELKTPYRTGRYTLSGITDQWQRIEIPLSDFRGLGRFKDIVEYVIVFDGETTRPKLGTIYIDNLCFCTA